jgi:CO/xanthine dehydrogenase Mo-binding subunit
VTRRQAFPSRSPLRASALQGLGCYANVFAIESFMDEMAQRVGIDPVQVRLRWLADERAGRPFFPSPAFAHQIAVYRRARAWQEPIRTQDLAHRFSREKPNLCYNWGNAGADR